jgi:hypothetical protein
LRLSFPINVNIEQNKNTDNFEVEIRNFIGEKIVRRVTMRPGVNVEASANQKDELQLTGNVRIAYDLADGMANANCSLLRMSPRAPPISSRSAKSVTRISESSWTVCTCRSGVTSTQMRERFLGSKGFFHGHMSFHALRYANGRLWG